MNAFRKSTGKVLAYLFVSTALTLFILFLTMGPTDFCSNPKAKTTPQQFLNMYNTINLTMLLALYVSNIVLVHVKEHDTLYATWFTYIAHTLLLCFVIVIGALNLFKENMACISIHNAQMVYVVIAWVCAILQLIYSIIMGKYVYDLDKSPADYPDTDL